MLENIDTVFATVKVCLAISFGVDKVYHKVCFVTATVELNSVHCPR